jgi:hypothetical protein
MEARTFKRLLRDQRGTASVEAALMLPVMAICWAGLMLRFDDVERHLDAAVEARRDAWVFSAQGCEVEGNDPPQPAGSIVHCLGDGQGWMATLSKIPFVGWLVSSITGFEVETIAKRDYGSPPLLGGGTHQIQYSYHLMCNEKSRDVEYILKACLCEQIHNLGLSLDFGLNCPGPPARGDKTCD